MNIKYDLNRQCRFERFDYYFPHRPGMAEMRNMFLFLSVFSLSLSIVELPLKCRYNVEAALKLLSVRK